MTKSDVQTPTGQSSAPADWGIDLTLRTPTSDEVVESEWRERRQHNRGDGQRLQKGHRRHHDDRLKDETTENLRRPLSELLEELSFTESIAWADIARLVGVSVPALRKWRRDENGASPVNREKVAQLAAFVQLLKGMTDVRTAAPVWFNVPFLTGYTVAPKHVYPFVNPALLLEVAGGSLSAEQFLTENFPDWRDRWRREYETVMNDEGEQVLVRYRTGVPPD